MTADDSCAMRMTHRVLSSDTASLSMPLPKTRWAVLEEAIKNHGKPASIMTYRRSQFYANASEVKEKEKEKEKGASVFEKKLVELGIKQILSGLTFTDQRQSRETTVRCSASCQSLRQS